MWLVDVLYGFKLISSMHFWAFTAIHRCTFGFSAQLIDVLLDFHLNSSMHFAFLDSYHRCTWGLEVH